MKRREFIKLAGISAALLPIAPSVFGEQIIPRRPHSYRLTYQVDLPRRERKRAYGYLCLIRMILLISLPRAAYGKATPTWRSLKTFPERPHPCFTLSGVTAAPAASR